MKIKTTHKIVMLLLSGSLLLQNCGSDDLPNEHCNKHWTLNEAHLKTLLFDYEETDTLLYKRTINDVVTDTVVFIKQRNYRDILKFHNGDADGDPACDEREFTRERIGWDYNSQFESISFNVQVVAGGAGNGSDDYMVRITDHRHIYNLLGASIGNFGVDFLTNYNTSEKTYDFTWDAPCVTSNQYTNYGEFNYSIRQKTEWFYSYNVDFGIIEISKTDRTEVWELIP